MTRTTEQDFPASSLHPFEDDIPERYEVNAFDQAVRAVDACECESMPCEHVAEYNRTRVRLMGKILALHATITHHKEVSR